MTGNHFPAVRISTKRLNDLSAGFSKELRNKKPETKGTYERALREFFRWHPGDNHFQFRIQDVERYKKYLSSKKKLSEVSVSTYLTALRQFCAYLVRIGILQDNPAKVVKGNKRPQKHSREIISQEGLALLLNSIDRSDERGVRDYAIVKAMIGCGFSEIELIRADIDDVKIYSHAMVLFVQGKGKDAKEGVVLPEEVKDALQSYLAFRSEADGSDPLFMSAGNRTRGKRMTTRGIRQRVTMYLERAGIKNGKVRRITPFSLRHTAASLMATSGATVEELQSRFRIGSAATAMLYMKRDENTV
ncbi:MAG: tyrosine-type recombinase/integrase [Bacteroidota bacterium]|nr:tyrosine-type recombinase/integrase [Bacteroidota bacterium]